MSRQAMHFQVFLLASVQALFQTASVLVMTVGGLAGGQIALRPELATTPIAAMFLSTAVVTFPASIWMARAGRRAGFVAGVLLGVAGGLIAAADIWLASLVLLSFGTFLVGVYQAFAQFYHGRDRLAAAHRACRHDGCAEEEARPQSDLGEGRGTRKGLRHPRLITASVANAARFVGRRFLLLTDCRKEFHR